MATIKSYTDIEQSKKLAEILAIESADMFYTTNRDWEGDIIGLLDVPLYIGSDSFIDTEMGEIYAWSLAALLSILPNNEHITTTLSRGGWKIEPVEYIDKWWCEYEDDSHTKDFTVSADNPVDACVTMIYKLHELNLM